MEKIFTMYFDDFENIILNNSIKQFKPLYTFIEILDSIKYFQKSIRPKYEKKLINSKSKKETYYLQNIKEMFEELCNNNFLSYFYKSFILEYNNFMSTKHYRKDMFSSAMYMLNNDKEQPLMNKELEEELHYDCKTGTIAFLAMLNLNLDSILKLFYSFTDKQNNMFNNITKMFLYKNLYMDSSKIFEQIPNGTNLFLISDNHTLITIEQFRHNYLNIKEELKDVNNYYEYLLKMPTILDKYVDTIATSNILFITAYNVYSFYDYINICIMYILNHNICIKKCHNCNNFFIPENRTDEKYCNRISPQNPNKTCKEYGAKKTYREEIKSRPIKYEHNKTSQFYRMRINRCKNNKEKSKYEKDFDTYKKTYQNKKAQYNAGNLQELEFVNWIKNQKTNNKEAED